MLKNVINTYKICNILQIEFSEFVNLMVKHGNPKEDDLKDAFKVFDQDDNGYIDAPELQSILSNMGENLTMEQVRERVRRKPGI